MTDKNDDDKKVNVEKLFEQIGKEVSRVKLNDGTEILVNSPYDATAGIFREGEASRENSHAVEFTQIDLKRGKGGKLETIGLIPVTLNAKRIMMVAKLDRDVLVDLFTK